MAVQNYATDRWSNDESSRTRSNLRARRVWFMRRRPWLIYDRSTRESGGSAQYTKLIVILVREATPIINSQSAGVLGWMLSRDALHHAALLRSLDSLVVSTNDVNINNDIRVRGKSPIAQYRAIRRFARPCKNRIKIIARDTVACWWNNIFAFARGPQCNNLYSRVYLQKRARDKMHISPIRTGLRTLPAL